MSTYMAKPNEVERKWYVVDAEGKTLGRLASRVAQVLRQAHTLCFETFLDVWVDPKIATLFPVQSMVYCCQVFCNKLKQANVVTRF